MTRKIINYSRLILFLLSMVYLFSGNLVIFLTLFWITSVLTIVLRLPFGFFMFLWALPILFIIAGKGLLTIISCLVLIIVTTIDLKRLIKMKKELSTLPQQEQSQIYFKKLKELEVVDAFIKMLWKKGQNIVTGKYR